LFNFKEMVLARKLTFSGITLLTIILRCICSNAQLILPLHPHPKSETIHQRKLKASHGRRNLEGFQNSAVYATFEIFGSSDKAKTIINQIKETRLHKMYHSKRDKMIRMSRLGAETHLYDNTINSFPLMQGYGSHYVTAYVGTPPQRTTLLVDTGSSQTAFPCLCCKNGCGDHTDSYFDPAKSSTYHKLSCNECALPGRCVSNDQCSVENHYLEGSGWKGVQSSDKFFLGNKHDEDNMKARSLGVDFTFGCECDESGLFLEQLENGIIGLIDTEFLLTNNLHKNKKISRNQFSICFGWEMTATKEGVHSGLMVIGGVDKRHHKTPMVFATNFSPGYFVKIRALYFQKTSKTNENEVSLIPANYADVPNSAVDTGTTYTILNAAYREGFIEQWKEVTGLDYNFAHEDITLSKEDISNLPTILIQLQGSKQGCGNNPGLAKHVDPKHCNDVVIRVPPSHYLLSYGKDLFTIAIEFNSNVGIIGANALQKHDVLFDNDNRSIGFAASDCKYDEVKQSS